MGMKLLDYRGWDSNLLLNLVGILLFYSINGESQYYEIWQGSGICSISKNGSKLCSVLFILYLFFIIDYNIVFTCEYNVQ